MENEKDYSLDRSVEVEKIIDFYKDIDNNTDDKPETEDKKQDNVFIQKAKSLCNKAFSYIKNTSLYKRFIREDNSLEDSEIESHAFGLSEKGRLALYHSISLVICITIIAISVVLMLFLPGNKAKIAEKVAELRNSDDYISLNSRHTAIKTEIDELMESIKEKETLLTQIADAENTKSDLRLQIEEKKSELNELNAQITGKRNIIAELDAAITSKAPAEKIYTPGKYIVGTHFAAGKYLVTGTGKFMIATSAGKSKINVTLNSTPLEVVLEDTDILKFDGKVKFTSVY